MYGDLDLEVDLLDKDDRVGILLCEMAAASRFWMLYSLLNFRA